MSGEDKVALVLLIVLAGVTPLLWWLNHRWLTKHQRLAEHPTGQAEDQAAGVEPYYVSAAVERALSEVARTGRDINIAGALYRKVNHGGPAYRPTPPAKVTDQAADRGGST